MVVTPEVRSVRGKGVGRTVGGTTTGGPFMGGRVENSEFTCHGGVVSIRVQREG